MFINLGDAEICVNIFQTRTFSVALLVAEAVNKLKLSIEFLNSCPAMLERSILRFQ